MLRGLVRVATSLAGVFVTGTWGVACLDRPIVASEPTTKTNYSAVQEANTITKIDLLFDIDNSASMGDKQVYLEKAVPDLVNRLVNPNCIDSGTGQSVGASKGGSCAAYARSNVEFPPVHDMHIGIISSSLGTRGVTGEGAVCDPTSSQDNNTGTFLDMRPALTSHVDDRGELLSRTATGPEQEGTSAYVGAQGFLDWFPIGSPANADTNPAGGISPPGPVLSPAAVPLSTPEALETDFELLVAGVHNYGCGIESQLETWYRFLIQPDPYDSISIAGGNVQWVGVDKTIIAQRHDFLRPDSLVAVIVLSDENDSEIDVRSYGGYGAKFMDSTFAPPRGNQACTTEGPGSPNCYSCIDSRTSKTDPVCALGNYPTQPGNDWGYYDNVRHVHMQAKYGIDPQFPLQRYVLGLTSAKVPDRDHEYPAGAGSYQGGTNDDPSDLDCANPLFAATLPDGSDLSAATLCNAHGAPGPRSSNLVFYAHIGGVPHEFLQATPGETDKAGNVLCAAKTATGQPMSPADCPQKDTLGALDWTKILGAGAAGVGKGPYDYTGIDPHMIEYYAPGRNGLNYRNGTKETIAKTAPASYPSGGGPDPIGGGDWVTNSLDATGHTNHSLPVDREYACIFPLETSRDCSQGYTPAGFPIDPANSFACDCQAVGLKGSEVSPVCGLPNPTEPYAPCSALGSCGTANDYTTQYYAKAYPTIRELTLAQLLGPQGIISSLCPIHPKETETGDPLYGYRPAITAIVNRLKSALSTQCLPQPLDAVETDAGLALPCLALASLPGTVSGDEGTECPKHPGLKPPDPVVLANFNANQHAAWLNATGTTDLSKLATCEVQQISVPPGGTCVEPGATKQGWCYVTGHAAGACDTQAVLFTPNTVPNGSTVNLQCILANVSTDGG
jgi:hypothetical protein